MEIDICYHSHSFIRPQMQLLGCCMQPQKYESELCHICTCALRFLKLWVYIFFFFWPNHINSKLNVINDSGVAGKWPKGGKWFVEETGILFYNSFFPPSWERVCKYAGSMQIFCVLNPGSLHYNLLNFSLNI